jgi:hypothetical protein
VLVSECGPWLREVAERIPSVVLRAYGPDGRDASFVRTFVDGTLLLERLDGKAIEIDPGEHVFRFELAGSRPMEERIVVVERDKGRRVAVRFASAAGGNAGPGEQRTATPPAVYVLGGVGIAGIALFGIFGGVGLSQKADLDDRGCKPNCPGDDIDAIQRSFLIGDISLGVGVAALGAATVVYVTRPSRAPKKAAPQGTRWIAAAPIAGGSAGLAGGSF